jgi:hypothetical protein
MLDAQAHMQLLVDVVTTLVVAIGAVVVLSLAGLLYLICSGDGGREAPAPRRAKTANLLFLARHRRKGVLHTLHPS